MSDQSSEPASPDETSSAKPGGKLRWLVDPDRRGFVLPITGLWILVLDWILFSSNALTLGVATPVVVTLGFLLGAVGTFVFQWRFADEGRWQVLLKSLLAGILVGLPWPIAGSFVGGWILLVSGLGNARKKLLE